MRLASASPSATGLVLDYNTINGSLTNFTFQSDTTYYITNEVDLYGTTTIEGGTVIKYSANGTETIVPSYLVWKTGPYRPAIFTGQDDDSVGQQITGSSGDPTETYYGFIALNLASCDTSLVSNARFSFLNTAVAINGFGSAGEMRDVQFNQCSTVMAGHDQGIDGDHSFDFYNVLAWNIGTFIGFDGDYGGQSVNCQNCTIDGCGQFFVDYTSIANLYNCICASVGWNAYEVNNLNLNSVLLDDDTGVFQTVGAANFYLADNTYRGIGSTLGLDSTLIADLSQSTTWPPFVYASTNIGTDLLLTNVVPRDTSPYLDPGYHYPAIDYALGDVCVTDATVTVSSGAVIAVFATNGSSGGLTIGTGGQLLSQSAPNALNRFIAYNTVQEQSSSSWNLPPTGLLLPNPSTTSPASLIYCRFTDFSVIAQDTAQVYDIAGCSQPVSFQDCQFHGGTLYSTNVTLNLTNCLLERVNTTLWANDGLAPQIQNCLFFGGNLDLQFANANALVQNNLFDQTTLADYGNTNYIGTFNAYVTNCNTLTLTSANDVFLTASLAYQPGPLGNYYQPSGSPLLNMGSTNANLLGLYEYTTQTNEVKDATNIVTIGYHYVAANSYGVPNSTLWLGIPDYIADSNGDGATNLIAWQLEYFGYTGLNPYADPFSEGTNLLQDFEGGDNLTAIFCSIGITNNYISTSNTPVTLTILGGLPYNMTVLVDNTNFGSAAWTNFTSNLVVNVGTNQGWHDVWISVAALNPLPPVWQRVRFNREYPPLLVITNPVPGTVSKPVIQLQGYVSETLSNFTYDLSNALAVITNQPVAITGEFADTNSFAITTNYFQIYDLFLTNGANVVTLHAKGFSGTTTTTNYTFTLDYSGDTTPPVITVAYPLTNSLVASSNFTLLGYLDDDTATLTVSNNDGSQTLSALVERGGTFSAPNLNLPNPTNTFTLFATDAAGNVTNQQLTVLQSPLTLTVTNPTPDQFSQSNFTVTGGISDSTQSVWVNGIQATVTGNSWSATLNTPGTPTLQLTVQAGPDLSSTAGDLSAYLAMPPQVQITSFSENYQMSDSVGCAGGFAYSSFDIFSIAWTLNMGGYTSDDSGSGPSYTAISTNWPAGLPWQFCSIAQSEGDSGYGCPSITGPTVDPFFQSLQIQSMLQLVADGPALPGIYELIRVTASASPYSSLDAAKNATGPGDGTPVLGSQIQMFGQMLSSTATNANVGEMFTVALTGQSNNVPYAVFDGSGNRQTNYSISPWAEDCTPAIMFNGTNITGSNITVIVGQQISLAIQPLLSNAPAISDFQWTIPAYAISNFIANTNTGTIYSNFPTGNSNVTFYWVDGGQKKVTCQVSSLGKSLLAQTTFTVISPDAQIVTFTNTHGVTVDTNFGRGSGVKFIQGTNYALHFGSPQYVETYGIILSNSLPLTLPTNFSGHIEWVQLLNNSTAFYFTNGAPFTNFTNFHSGYDATNYPVVDPSIDDSPGTPFNSSSLSGVVRQDNFQVWLMFHLDSQPSVSVPLQGCTWGWYGAATNTGSNWTGSGISFVTSSSNTSAFPQWIKNVR